MSVFLAIGAVLVLLSLALLMRPLWPGARREAVVPADALDPEPAAGAAGWPRKLVSGLTLFVCAVTVGGYALIGTPRALDPAAAAAAEVASGNGASITAAQIEAMVEKLAAHTKEKPGDTEGWAMLGRAYVVLGRFEQAAPALKQAVALRGNDATLLTDYADALAMASGRTLEGEPARLIAQALHIEPNNLKALSLAGTLAFNRKDYAQALQHWEKLARLATDRELVQQVQGGIDEARRLAGAIPAGNPATAAPPPVSAAASGVAISGTVTLAPALAAKARPDDTLFVFARAVAGPRMPLAILRKRVGDLPLSFTLDDSMAMSPAARLSSAAQVVVGARVSARGDAMPQPGDLQGFSAPVAPGASGLRIEISEIVAKP